MYLLLFFLNKFQKGKEMNNSISSDFKDLTVSYQDSKIKDNQQGKMHEHQVTTQTFSMGGRIMRLIQALALTILTGGIALFFPFVRGLWSEALTGKKIVELDPNSSNHLGKEKALYPENSNDIKKLSKKVDELQENIHELHKKNQPKIITQEPSIDVNSQKIKHLMNPVNLKIALEDPKQIPFPKEHVNKLFEIALGEEWLSPKHLFAFTDLTEIDLTIAHYPINQELIETILTKCKHIKTIKVSAETKPKELYGSQSYLKSKALNQFQVFCLLLNKSKFQDAIQIPEKGLFKSIFLELNEQETAALAHILQKQPNQLLPILQFLYQVYHHHELDYLSSHYKAKYCFNQIFNSMKLEEVILFISQLIKAKGESYEPSNFLKIFPAVLLEKILLASSQQVLDNFDLLFKSSIDSLSFHASKELRKSLVKNCGKNQKILFALCSDEKSVDMVLENLSHDQLLFLIQEINHCAQEKSEKKNCGLGTETLVRLIDCSIKLLPQPHFYHLVGGLSKKIQEEIFDFIEDENGKSYDGPLKIKLKAHLVFCSVLENVKAKNKEEVIKNLKKLSPAKQNSYSNTFTGDAHEIFGRLIAEKSEIEDLSFLFLCFVDYSKESDRIQELMISFMKGILKKKDKKTIMKAFQEFWIAKHHFDIQSPYCLPQFLNYIEKIEVFEDVVNSVPEDLDDLVLKEIMTQLLMGFSGDKKYYSSSLPYPDKVKTLKNWPNEKLKNIAEKIIQCEKQLKFLQEADFPKFQSTWVKLSQEQQQELITLESKNQGSKSNQLQKFEAKLAFISILENLKTKNKNEIVHALIKISQQKQSEKIIDFLEEDGKQALASLLAKYCHVDDIPFLFTCFEEYSKEIKGIEGFMFSFMSGIMSSKNKPEITAAFKEFWNATNIFDPNICLPKLLIYINSVDDFECVISTIPEHFSDEKLKEVLWQLINGYGNFGYKHTTLLSLPEKIKFIYNLPEGKVKKFAKEIIYSDVEEVD